MKWDGMFSLVLGIFVILAIILVMQGLAGGPLAGGNWETVAQRVAPTIIALAVFGFVASVAFLLLRK